MSVDISNATATAGVDPSRVRIAGAIKQAANTTGNNPSSTSPEFRTLRKEEQRNAVKAPPYAVWIDF